MPAFQHGQLLPESETFKDQASLRLKAAGEQAPVQSDVAEHEEPSAWPIYRLGSIGSLFRVTKVIQC